MATIEGSMETFAAGFGGVALTPTDAGYDEARAVWNGSFHKRPAVIARCRTTAEVGEVVTFARESGVGLAVRGGGHRLAGPSPGDGVGGLALFPLDRGEEVLRRYRSWVAELPDEFSTLAGVVTAPPAPFVPQDLVGRKAVAIVGCWCGDPDAGEAALRPIRELKPGVDVFGPMPYPVLQGMLDEGAPPGRRSYTRSGYAAELGDGLIGAVLEHGERM